jgi:hypothetical protein
VESTRGGSSHGSPGHAGMRTGALIEPGKAPRGRILLPDRCGHAVVVTPATCLQLFAARSYILHETTGKHFSRELTSRRSSPARRRAHRPSLMLGVPAPLTTLVHVCIDRSSAYLSTPADAAALSSPVISLMSETYLTCHALGYPVCSLSTSNPVMRDRKRSFSRNYRQVGYDSP